MSRNAFPDCEREYNRREEAVEMAKDQRTEALYYKEMAEKYKAELASYKLWAEVEMADLREDLSDHIRMAKDAQEDAGRYRWLRDMNNDESAVKLFSDWCGQNLDENIDAAIKGNAT